MQSHAAVNQFLHPQGWQAFASLQGVPHSWRDRVAEQTKGKAE
jgi:hypothetical protein